MNRIRAAAAALIASSAIALLVPAQAMAAGPIYNGDGSCSFEAYRGSPAPHYFSCSFTWSGGTGPISATATASSPAGTVHFTSVGANDSSGGATGTCGIGYSGAVTLHLVDSLGYTANLSASLACYFTD